MTNTHIRFTNKCCGGSLVISLDAPADVIPALDLHREFIQINAAGALHIS
jgi:hypothetical protein